MRKGKNGEIDGASLAVSSSGNHIKDIANKIASGVKLCDIDEGDLAYLRQLDPELCDAATKIGAAVRGFSQLSDLEKTGELTYKEFAHDCKFIYL